MILRHRQRLQQKVVPVANGQLDSLSAKYVDKYIADQKSKATTSRANIMSGANNGVNAQVQSTAVIKKVEPSNSLASKLTFYK